VTETAKPQPVPQPVPRPQQAEKQLNLYQRWNRVLGELESVEKAGVNKEQGGYRYMETPDLLKALRPLLAKHGLVLKTNPAEGTGVEAETSLGLAMEDSEYQSSQGKTMHYVRLRMEYTLVNIDDPTDKVTLIGISDASDVADKAIHKCRTSALKYTLRDNFLVDAQDDAESDKETHERGGSQTRVGGQSSPAARPEPSRNLEGVVMEATAESDTERNWLQFTLNNFAEPLISFQANLWPSVKPGTRLKVRAVQNSRQGGGMYWRAAEITVVSEPPAASGEPAAADQNDFDRMVPGTAPAPKGESAAEVLKRMYPTPKNVKTRRMVEEAIKRQPEDVGRPAMIAFEKRIASEKPSTELGVLALLDISIQEAIEAAAIAAEGVPTR
jgi:hypothetical protein